MTQRACRVRVSGRVQGVCFRASTQRQAAVLGIHGWVRNLRDGSVDAWLQGEASNLAEMLEWIQQGPADARVTAVDIYADQPPEPGLSGFQIRY